MLGVLPILAVNGSNRGSVLVWVVEQGRGGGTRPLVHSVQSGVGCRGVCCIVVEQRAVWRGKGAVGGHLG